MTLGMRKLVGGIALIAAVLVVLDYMTGAEWVRLILGMFGVTA